MIRLMFLISVLNRGGAERQLTLLAKSIDQRRFSVTVVTVYGGGPLWADLEGVDGIELLSLHKKSRGDYLRPLWRLARIMGQRRPHIVHGYLGVANILSLLFGKPNGAKVVWGLRASDIDFAMYDRLSAWHFRLAAWLSRYADLIIANSNAGKKHHALNGFADARMIVIPNGFDTAQFAPEPERGQQMRRTWGVADHEQLIGLVARLDPIKDHATFLRAAALLAQDCDHARFVCIGGGPAPYARRLQELADELGLHHRLIWAGEIGDMRAAHSALDLATSTSISEGFSNTVGEAMACGVPCVVTDVGDSAQLVGSTGLVVPPRDPVSLAAAWRAIIDMSDEQRIELGHAARNRIITEYSLAELTRKTERVLTDVMASAVVETPRSRGT